MSSIAALYIDPRGPYPSISGVDAWDENRDATGYEGPAPIVAHPPCGPWGRLRWSCKYQRRDLAPIAVRQLLQWGGVLEHPAQVWWGHPCRKRSWLLLRGVSAARATMLLPPRVGSPIAQIGCSRRHPLSPGQRHATPMERRLTPKRFAEWLVALASEVSREVCDG